MVQQRKKHTNYLITGAFMVLILLLVFLWNKPNDSTNNLVGKCQVSGPAGVFYYLNPSIADGRAGRGLKMSVWVAAVVQISMLYVCFTVQYFI